MDSRSITGRVATFLNRIVDIITFKGLTIRWRFTLFFFGTLFWFIALAGIGIALLLAEDSYRRSFEAISRHDKVGQMVIRKLRGVSLSAHKVAFYDDFYEIKQHADRGKTRLDDASGFIWALARGGIIRDYSKALEHLFDEFTVEPVPENSEQKKLLTEAEHSIGELRESFDKLTALRLSVKPGAGKNPLILTGLKEVDSEAMKIIAVLSNFSSANSRLSKDYRVGLDRLNKLSTTAIVLSLSAATTLLLIFLIRLSDSMTGPIKTMTGYIGDISAGAIPDSYDYANLVEKDEMGALFRKFHSLVKWFTDLNSFKKVIEEDYTIEDIYSRLAEVFRKYTGIDAFVIYEVAGSKNSMKVMDSAGLSGDPETYCSKDILVDSNLCRARKTGHTVSSLEYPDVCRQFLFGKDKDHICLPLIMGGNTCSIIQFSFDKQKDRNVFEEANKKITTAKQYIEAAIPVIEAKRLQTVLRESSLRDVLTGLHNRRFLEEYVENLVSGTLRRKTQIGILMCDIDYFKEINDLHGHDVGDIVLRETANILKNAVRTSDIVVRFGGEEFLAILVDIREDDAHLVAERIRSNMEGLKIKTPGGVIQKTISIGISEFPKDTEQFWEAIKFSDVSLYRAKESGRNRVVKFTSDMWHEGRY